MLVLDVEFMLGVCFAARSPSDPEPDWPPQPDRVFSALVSTWAARGQHESERSALEWLERLEPPSIHASDMTAREGSKVFVPPNDAKPSQLQMIPARRKRQERRFQAAIPHDSVVSYSWDSASADQATFQSLQSLARDTSYVGHSASLVRCFFRDEPEALEREGKASRLRVYPGRFAELTARFKDGQRPSPGEPARLSDTPKSLIPQSVFGNDWFVFADAGGECPDVRAIAVVARAMRAAIMSGFGGRPVPEVISGHTAGGPPSSIPHLGIFPLANVGWRWSDGRLMGLALCLPRESQASDRKSLLQALATCIRARGGEEHGEVELNLPGSAPWRLVMQPEPTGSSLKPFRYIAKAARWATATPIALDRHPKEKQGDALQAEISAMVSDACARIGLPKPVCVVPDKHSAIRGAVAARPSSRMPGWTHWTLPGPLHGRVLTHATLVFEEPVQGPIALGAGRFQGLGLCLPLVEEACT
jgi:CRISPR-associated protein Csb2